MALAAIAQFAAPPLVPVAAALFLYTTLPTFRGAYDVLLRQRRAGVDFLDAVVVLGCLATLQLFSGAMLAEPHRVFRRLQSLRGWSDGEAEIVGSVCT